MLPSLTVMTACRYYFACRVADRHPSFGGVCEFIPTRTDALQALFGLSAQYRHGYVLERAAQLLVIGHHRAHDLPERRAVIHLAQVRELVRDDVVDHLHAEVHETPVQADRTVGRGRTPAGLRRAERQPGH